jgi:adenosylcobyric acid synthase
LTQGPIDAAILAFPGAGETQELEPLFADPAVSARWVREAGSLGDPDLIVLPGSERTLADLAWMRRTGLFDAVLRSRRAGAVVLGICGGLQILGTLLRDPERLEGGDDRAHGLGLLPVETDFARDEINESSHGTSTGALLPEAARVTGREIHGGRSLLVGDACSIFGEAAKGGGRCPLGIATADLGVVGTYLHDVLLDDAFRAAIVARARRA